MDRQGKEAWPKEGWPPTVRTTTYILQTFVFAIPSHKKHRMWLI